MISEVQGFLHRGDAFRKKGPEGPIVDEKDRLDKPS